jgi:hypothetical protein
VRYSHFRQVARRWRWARSLQTGPSEPDAWLREPDNPNQEIDQMKKLLLGLVAAFALASFAAPVRAEEAAGGAAPADGAKKEKKAKKGKKAEKAAEGGDTAKKE